MISPSHDGPSSFAEARTLDDLIRPTVAFLRGELGESPTHAAPPDTETGPLIDVLVTINQAGLITTSSQPGVIDSAGAQRAHVEGICSPDVASRVERGLLDTDLVVLSFAPGTSAWGSIVVTVDGGDPFTFLGRHDDSDLDLFDNGSPELRDALEDAWTLQIFDPVWGRNDRLWTVLSQALTEGE